MNRDVGESVFWRGVARSFMALDWVMQRTVVVACEAFSAFLDKAIDAEYIIKEEMREKK